MSKTYSNFHLRVSPCPSLSWHSNSSAVLAVPRPSCTGRVFHHHGHNYILASSPKLLSVIREHHERLAQQREAGYLPPPARHP